MLAGKATRALASVTILVVCLSIGAAAMAKAPRARKLFRARSTSAPTRAATPVMIDNLWRDLTSLGALPCTSVQMFGDVPVQQVCAQAQTTTEPRAQAPAAPAPTPSPAVIQNEKVIETGQGFIATAPLTGAGDGAFVVVYGGGVISAINGNGDTIWTQPSLNFIRQTGRYPNIAFPFSPQVAMGYDAADPFTEVGVHPFAVGDVNGDGVADVAVAHFFKGNNSSVKGNSQTMVSVLDGRDGHFIWTRLYDGYVPEVLIVDLALVVAVESGDYKSSIFLGTNGAVSRLEAWSFATASPSLIWNVSTGAGWARWLALERINANIIAAAWTNTAAGAGGNVYGHVLAISPNDGAISWDATTAGWPRFVRGDSSRNRVIVVEQADATNTKPSYTIVARGLTNGATVASVSESDAYPLSFDVGDVNGDGMAEWIAGDLFLSAGPVSCPDTTTCLGGDWAFRAGRVHALAGSDGSELWNQQRGTESAPAVFGGGGVDTARPYRVLAASNSVLVASFMPGVQDRELEAVNGATGAVAWSRRATNLFFPLFLSRDGDLVRVASSRNSIYGAHPVGIEVDLDATGTNFLLRSDSTFEVVRSIKIDNGADAAVVPLFGRINSVAATDVNSDGTKDLLVGGESGAVFALDSTQLSDPPRVLWRRAVGGAVRQIQVADLDGDGIEEAIVAATHEVDVLNARTGALRYSIPLPNETALSVSLGDLDGDGKIDIVIPGAALTAIKGNTGTQLWRYAPTSATPVHFSNAVITAERIVVAQYLEEDATNGVGGAAVAPQDRGYVALAGASGVSLWSNYQPTQNSRPFLWKSTQLSSLASTSAIAFTWLDGTAALPGVRVDRLEAVTGQSLGSGVSSDIGTYIGSFNAEDHGDLAHGWQNSALLGSSTMSAVLRGYFPNNLAFGNFGSLGRRLVMAQFGDSTNVMQATTLTAAAESSAGTRFGPVSGSDVHVVDLDGDGWDEAIATPFDYDGWGLALVPGNGFVVSPYVQPQGLKVERIAPRFPNLPRAVSRKIHGNAGPFDVDLPLAGTGGVECRSGGPNGDYQIVVIFDAPVTVERAAITGGVGELTSTNADGNTVTLNLTHVSNSQTITVTLTNISDGVNVGDLSVPMVVHTGDINADGAVNSADISQTKSQSGQPLGLTNFREDVNVDGDINSADISLVKSKSGT